MNTKSLSLSLFVFLAVSLFSTFAAAGGPTKTLYRSWSAGDCKALVNGNDIYCDSGDCKALVNSNDIYCETEDCKAVVNGNDIYCETDNCKALVNQNDIYCK